MDYQNYNYYYCYLLLLLFTLLLLLLLLLYYHNWIDFIQEFFGEVALIDFVLNCLPIHNVVNHILLYVHLEKYVTHYLSSFPNLIEPFASSVSFLALVYS